MKKILFFLVLLLMFAPVGHASYTNTKPQEATSQSTVQSDSAKAVLLDASGKEVGWAAITQAEKGIKIDLGVAHLTPGEHAFHIHETGSCEAPDFKSAGGHFNPFGKKHGLSNLEGSHAGDMPNMVVSSDGSGTVTRYAPDTTIESLFQENGTALVIHAGPDDYVSDPAGAAGARIACGVITQ